jgi:acetyltransferase-like isoleucine patch superfamily enzyme
MQILKSGPGPTRVTARPNGEFETGGSHHGARYDVVAGAPTNDAPYRLIDDVAFGEGVIVMSFANLYGCVVGDGTRIGPFVEIQRGASIGARCKIQSHTFICDGVRIGDGVFVGHGVLFVNDRTPRALREDGGLQTAADWRLLETVVEDGASLGSGCVVLGGITVGAGALVGAGAVVTRDVPPGATVAGVPARVQAQETARGE